MNKLKCKVYKDKKGEWRWTLWSSNGKKIADSAEGYVKKSACMKFPSKLLAAGFAIKILIH